MGITLAVIMVVVLFASVVVDSVVANLHFSLGSIAAVRSRLVAESLVAQAFERLIATNGAYGLAGESLCRTDGPVSGELSFGVPSQPWMQGSCNNLPQITQSGDTQAEHVSQTGDHSVVGAWGHIVPMHGVQLVGNATNGGIVTQLESMAVLPAGTYAVASSGQFAGQGYLAVGSVPSPSPPATAVSPDLLDDDQLLPAVLCANGGDVGSTAAATLPAYAHVVGDVVTRGRIYYPPGAPPPHAHLMPAQPTPLPLPSVDFSAYESSTLGTSATNLLNGDVTLSGTQQLEGFWLTQGLTVAGDVVLDDAVLFVHGDLRIHGSLSGTGAVFVSGLAVIDHGASLRANNMVALATQGNLVLGSSGAAGSVAPDSTSSFGGIVYTEGDFSANGMYLVGCFEANASAGSRVNISNCRVIAGPSAASFSVTGSENGMYEAQDGLGDTMLYVSVISHADGSGGVQKTVRFGSYGFSNAPQPATPAQMDYAQAEQLLMSTTANSKAEADHLLDMLMADVLSQPTQYYQVPFKFNLPNRFYSPYDEMQVFLWLVH